VPVGGGEEWKVYQQKLRVVYLPPEGQTVEEEDEGHIEHPVPHITPVRAEPSGGPSVSALTTLGHPEY
jgi:vesicle-associated membrane protein-associated protein A